MFLEYTEVYYLTNMLVAGIDEAGRGPVIGPLVISGVILEDGHLLELTEMGLTDSKLLTKKKREVLYEKITNLAIEHYSIIIPASEIDKQMTQGVNLNRIEKNTIIEILSKLKKWTTAYVDACDVNAQRFQMQLYHAVQRKIIAEHSADLKYPVVSAASIIAKVTRDQKIKELHNDFGIDFGSGYPNDPKTTAFIKTYYSEFKEMPHIVRRCWQTTKKIIVDSEQISIERFFYKTK